MATQQLRDEAVLEAMEGLRKADLQHGMAQASLAMEIRKVLKDAFPSIHFMTSSIEPVKASKGAYHFEIDLQLGKREK